MENYIQKIMNVLFEKDIPCCYNDKEQLIYSDFEFTWGNVFSIYEYEDATIINYCIYDLTIPEQKIEKVFEYLDYLNTKVDYGYFYIDHRYQKVAFGVDYDIENMKLDKDEQKFNQFCLLWYNLSSVYGEKLSQIATNKPKVNDIPIIRD